MKLGQGKPKICVPITGTNEIQLRQEIDAVKQSCCDLVEWRADYFSQADDCEAVKAMLHELRELLSTLPLLFTFRTKEEGGERQIDLENYTALCKSVIASGDIDIIDVELSKGDSVCRDIIQFAHEYNTCVFLSSHDFQKTPSKDILLSRFRKMQELQADVPKIAVMPHCAADVLTLLSAANTFTETYADRPIIAISMGWLGGVSRIAGEVFGSALTFGIAAKASAPGQMSANDVSYMLDLLHNKNPL